MVFSEYISSSSGAKFFNSISCFSVLFYFSVTRSLISLISSLRSSINYLLSFFNISVNSPIFSIPRLLAFWNPSLSLCCSIFFYFLVNLSMLSPNEVQLYHCWLDYQNHHPWGQYQRVEPISKQDSICII